MSCFSLARSGMAFRLNIPFLRKRRSRDAAYVHADLRHITEAPWWERVWRWLFKLEYCDNDGRLVFAWLRIRRSFRWVFVLLFSWFVVESLTAWNIFNG